MESDLCSRKLSFFAKLQKQPHWKNGVVFVGQVAKVDGVLRKLFPGQVKSS